MKEPKTQKQALLEAFKAALDNSSVTATEMAWNLKLEPGQIQELLDGTLKPTDEQECWQSGEEEESSIFLLMRWTR